MAMMLNDARDYMAAFNFSQLFIEVLGWSFPDTTASKPITEEGLEFFLTPIAQLGGVVVFEITSANGEIPDKKIRKTIYERITLHHHESLPIFVDQKRSQSIWFWGKRADIKIVHQEHYYFRGQPGDLFLGKLKTLYFGFSDFNEDGKISVTTVTHRLEVALDVERVTKKFYSHYQEHHLQFQEFIGGIDNEKDRHWYASVMLNRLMFIYFLQKKFFLDNGDERYLQNKLAKMREEAADQYYTIFLQKLFFEGFAKPEENRSAETNALLGKIKYLNGGLFLRHSIEESYKGKIVIPDRAFDNLFALFENYSWNLNDTPGGKDDEINPDVLGYIFEKYINQKDFGAYYTRPEITEYLCDRTIYQLVLDRINHAIHTGRFPGRPFPEIGELLMKLDSQLCVELWQNVLPTLRLLDPACGSAAFLVAAMKTLINLYSAVIGKIKFLPNCELFNKIEKIEATHPSLNYYIKKEIITHNLYGVDIMDEGIEIAKLRLFLALVAAARQGEVDDLEPLPNIDFNIMTGNSLIGLIRVDKIKFDQKSLFPEKKTYEQIVAEKEHLVAQYRSNSSYLENLQTLRDDIYTHREEAIQTLNVLLSDNFIVRDDSTTDIKIPYEEAVYDEKNKKVRYKKRNLKESDIAALKPFHWGFEFNEIINIDKDGGGFDAIITNPPWEIFKPNAKEFFEYYSELVTKKKMTIKDFEKEQATILQDPEIRKAWLHYLSQYPHVSAFFRSAPQYKNQISIVNGKKAGTDINLYKLFTEQCFNLLRKGGYCGIVIPSGIYTDLGTKQLREMLFNQTSVTGLFCFENRKGIFENVDSRFKFVVLTYEKGGTTKEFPTAFMRHDVEELERFPKTGALNISVDLLRRLSSDSLSIMEFKNSMDIEISQRMLQFPLLGTDIPDKWNLKLTREFDMTNDSHLFKTEPGEGRLPLYEGKMFHQYNCRWGEPKYWLIENEARGDLLKNEKDIGQLLDYQHYRLAFRDIAASTNERAMIMTILPPNVFCPHTVSLEKVSESKLTHSNRLFVLAIMNSFALDYLIRQRMTSHLSFYIIYNLPIPRLTQSDDIFFPIVQRAAKLICTSPEFDDLAKEIFGPEATAATIGLTDPVERAACRAQLDGIIAHLYRLTQEEFAHILTTFPIVKQEVKDAALAEYRALMPLVPDQDTPTAH